MTDAEVFPVGAAVVFSRNGWDGEGVVEAVEEGQYVVRVSDSGFYAYFHVGSDQIRLKGSTAPSPN
jgi:hypothetical protein